jgi:PKD repeat protein
MIYNSDLGRTPSIASIVNAVNVAKANGLWIILDHHAYTDSFDTDPLWDQVIAAVKDQYDRIIWQPQNEPAYSLSTLTTMYQNWINKVRATGDTHWIVVSIDYQGFGAPGDSGFLSQFPQVTDPINKIFYDFHDYYFYQYHSAWSVSDAQAYADHVPVAVNSLISAYGRPVLITETGADASGGGGWPSDTVVAGSAGYAPESLAYVSREISDLDAIHTGYMLWTADDWTGTPGAGATGALNIWGQYLPLPASSLNPPLTGSFNYQPSPVFPNTTVTFNATASNGTSPYTYNWTFGDGTRGSGQQVTHKFSTTGTYNVTLTTTDAAQSQFTTSQSITVVQTPPSSGGTGIISQNTALFSLATVALIVALTLTAWTRKKGRKDRTTRPETPRLGDYLETIHNLLQDGY